MAKGLNSTRIYASMPLAIVLGCLALGAAALAGSYLSAWFSTVCAAVALASGFRSIWVHALGRASQSIVTLRFSSAFLEFESRDGKWAEIKSVRGSFVHPLLTIMVVALNSGFLSYRVLLVVPRRMGRDDFRRFRVWLRWQNADREGKSA